jgi:DNA-binding transcriptional LysR family regulator
MGVAVLQETVARGFIRRGELISLLPEYKVDPPEPRGALYAVHPGLANCPPKTRVFVDFLVDLFNGRQN